MNREALTIVRRHVDAMFEELLVAANHDIGEELPLEANVSKDEQLASAADDALARAGTSRWELVDEREGETYSWPEGLDEYATFRIYECVSAPLGRYAIGQVVSVDREYWGAKRPYFVVFKLGAGGGSRQPIAVFVATDDYDESGAYVAVIRGAGGPRGQRMFDPDQSLPRVYGELPIVTFRDRVAGTSRFRGFNKLAVLARDDQPETMLRHAAAQVALRH